MYSFALRLSASTSLRSFDSETVQQTRATDTDQVFRSAAWCDMRGIPRRTGHRERITIGVPYHRAAGAVAGPVVTGAVVAGRKRGAVDAGASQHIVLGGVVGAVYA